MDKPMVMIQVDDAQVPDGTFQDGNFSMRCFGPYTQDEAEEKLRAIGWHEWSNGSISRWVPPSEEGKVSISTAALIQMESEFPLIKGRYRPKHDPRF